MPKRLKPCQLVTLVLAASGFAASAEIDLSKLPPAASTKGLTYQKDIRPLFEASCLKCHGTERPKAGLRLDSLQAALQGSKDRKVILPGKSKESFLVHAASQLDDEIAMPPKFRPGRGGPGGSGGQGRQGGPPPGGAGQGERVPPPGGGQGGSGGRGGWGPPPKPLTAEQVGLVRAWIDEGAK